MTEKVLLCILLSIFVFSSASIEQNDSASLSEIKSVTHHNDEFRNERRLENPEDLIVMRGLEVSCIQRGLLEFNWLEPAANFRFDPKDTKYHIFMVLGEGYDFESSDIDDLIETFKSTKNHYYAEIKGETHYEIANIIPTNKIYSILFMAQVGNVFSPIEQSTMDVVVHGVVPKLGNSTDSDNLFVNGTKKLKVEMKGASDKKIAVIIISGKELENKFKKITVNTTLAGTLSGETKEPFLRTVTKVKFKKNKVVARSKLADSSEIYKRLQADSISIAGVKNETDNGRNEIKIFDIQIATKTPIFDGLTFETLFRLYSRIKWGFKVNWHCARRICGPWNCCCFCINVPNGVREVYAILVAGFRAEAKFLLSKEWTKEWKKDIPLFNSATRAITVWAGPVPIIFTYSFHMALELSLNIKAKITATLGAWLDGSLELGLRQRGNSNSFDPVRTANFNYGTWLPQDNFKATFSLTADAGLHLYTKVLVYYLVGGRIGVKPGINFATEGSLTANGLATTKFDLILYFKMPLAFIVATREVWSGEYTLHTISLLPKIRNVGLNNVSNLGWCEGDCDSDSHCKNGFKCKERSSSEPVISCQGSAENAWDYCIPMFII